MILNDEDLHIDQLLDTKKDLHEIVYMIALKYNFNP